MCFLSLDSLDCFIFGIETLLGLRFSCCERFFGDWIGMFQFWDGVSETG